MFIRAWAFFVIIPVNLSEKLITEHHQFPSFYSFVSAFAKYYAQN